MERNSPRKRKLSKLETVKKRIKNVKSEPKQLFNKNIKHPYSNLIRERAGMMPQFYQAKIYIKEERFKSTTGIEAYSVENSHSTVIDEMSTEKNITVTHMMLLPQ